MTIVLRDWRQGFRDAALRDRLELAGCPVSLTVLLASVAVRNQPLTEWVNLNLSSGVMLRTSQSEHIARGRSVQDTARLTGITVRQVLYQLTRFEEEEAAVIMFYNPRDEDAE